MSSSVSKGNAFEEEVEGLLRLKGYSVSRNELISGTQIDLLARKEEFLNNLCHVVECTDRHQPVGIELVRQKASVLLSLRDNRFLFRLIFVARSGFTAEAKAFAREQPNLQLVTLVELENQLIDFAPYANWYLHNYENSVGLFAEGRLFDGYIELSARDEQNGIIASLTNEVKGWLVGQSTNNLLFLLGEYGSGKTSFCRQLVYRLLDDKYAREGNQRFVPILVNLRDYRNASNIRQVITDTLVNQYGVALPSFMAFERHCSGGRILLVLDGFDEMADKCDEQTLVDCFAQIYLLASLNAKILLTCRSNFFRSHLDAIELLKRFSINVPFVEEAEERVAELPFEHHGRILYVQKFSEEQIRQYIKKRLGTDAESIVSAIQSIHDLSDLSTRPVLLDMILTTLPELISKEKPINSAALYEHYTDKWTTRDDWRVNVPLEVRQSFCEILCWLMHNSDMQEIGYEFLEKAMIQSLQGIIESEDQLEQFKNDIQTCSFLVRVGKKDGFMFAHKSFLEFFVARKIIADLLKGLMPPKPKNEPRPSEESREDLSSGFMPSSRIILTFMPSEIDRWRKDETRGDLFSTLRINLTRRVRRSDSYVTFLRGRRGGGWPTTRPVEAIKNHLEKQIGTIANRHGLEKASRDLGLSEEIATFAIEYFDNTGVSLREFVSKLLPEDSLALFCDILRLSQSSEFVKSNSEFLKDYVKSGKREMLRISSCAALAKVPSLIDPAFVWDSRKTMTAQGWSYFLFELASRGKDYREIIEECFKCTDLRTVDKIICLYGMQEGLKEEDSRIIGESLVTELVNSSDDHEKSLGLTLSEGLPHGTLLKTMAKIFRQTNDDGLKREVMSIVESFGGDDAWKLLRALQDREDDAHMKRLLRESGKRIRDDVSLKKVSVSWGDVKTKQVIRNKMWKSLR